MLQRLQGWLEDWRFLVLVYIVCSGVWGVLAKFASARLDSRTTTFFAVSASSIVVIIATFQRLHSQSMTGVVAATIGGVLGAISALAFYGALRRAPASLVLPTSSLYLILTVVLAHVFLGESIKPRQLAGIALGLLAIALLAK